MIYDLSVILLLAATTLSNPIVKKLYGEPKWKWKWKVEIAKKREVVFICFVYILQFQIWFDLIWLLLFCFCCFVFVVVVWEKFFPFFFFWWLRPAPIDAKPRPVTCPVWRSAVFCLLYTGTTDWDEMRRDEISDNRIRYLSDKSIASVSTMRRYILHVTYRWSIVVACVGKVWSSKSKSSNVWNMEHLIIKLLLLLTVADFWFRFWFRFLISGFWFLLVLRISVWALSSALSIALYTLHTTHYTLHITHYSTLYTICITLSNVPIPKTLPYP